MVAPLIMCGEDQRHTLSARQRAQFSKFIPMMVQLGCIATAEFGPPCGIMSEPFA